MDTSRLNNLTKVTQKANGVKKIRPQKGSEAEKIGEGGKLALERD